MPKSAPPPEPPADWRGFVPTFYTQIPDEFFDVWLPHLSGAECKVLCYLMRHTFGWKKTHDRLSFAQITRGIIRRDGTRLDGGAGVAVSTAQRAIEELVARGLIVAEPTMRADGGKAPTRYYIRMAEVSPGDYRKSAMGLPMVGNAPYPASAIQDTVIQETTQETDDSIPPTPAELAIAQRAGITVAQLRAIQRGAPLPGV